MFSESLFEATRAAIQVQQGAEAELLPALSPGWLLKDAVGSFSQLGRWTAKRAPATVLGLPQVHTSLMNIEILAGSSSASEAYVGHQPASVSISLSHRDGVAACAISQSTIALGCDVELIETRNEAFVRITSLKKSTHSSQDEAEANATSG